MINKYCERPRPVESEFVTLPDDPHEIDDDRLVEGMAICPEEFCRVGRMMPFDLEAKY